MSFVNKINILILTKIRHKFREFQGFFFLSQYHGFMIFIEIYYKFPCNVNALEVQRTYHTITYLTLTSNIVGNFGNFISGHLKVRQRVL